jgi:hypothetical protein
MTTLRQQRLLAAALLAIGLLGSGHSALAREIQPADDRTIQQVDARRGDTAGDDLSVDAKRGDTAGDDLSVDAKRGDTAGDDLSIDAKRGDTAGDDLSVDA